MQEILPADSIREIDLIINEVTLFRTIILNLQSHFGKFKVLKEIRKYRTYNYDRFIEETESYIDLEKRSPLSQTVRTDYYKLENKFLSRNIELLTKYRDRVVEIQDIIIYEYYR